MYYYFNFFKNFVEHFADSLDQGVNPFFPKGHYNYFKTKDGRYISIGNLEKKFQKNFIAELEKLDPDSKDKKYTIERVMDTISKFDRDELIKKVILFK
jgi:hypothetical protein